MFRSTTPSWSASLGVVLRQSAQQLTDHRLKPAICLGCSDLGTLALWHFCALRLGASCSNEWTAWSHDVLLNRTPLRIDVNLTVQLTI